MSNWYDAPKKVKPVKEKKPKPEWVKPFWPAVSASIGSGAIFGILVFIVQYIFPSPLSPPLDFGGEIGTLLLLIFMSASFGLVFGFPFAFLFGKLIINKTQGLNQPIQNIIRIFLGGLFAIIAKAIMNILINKSIYSNGLNYEYIIVAICGMIAAIIFYKTMPKYDKDL